MRTLDILNEPATEFGLWLYQNIERRGISMRQVARDLDISPTTVSYHISGKRLPGFRMVKEYCDYFCEGDVFWVYEMTLKDRE